MNQLLAILLSLRLVGVFALGALLGSLANLAIYRLAWNQRRISPWSAPEPKAPPRRRADRVPILGWLGLSRERALHGDRFWIRPMLIELAMAIGLATLYGWEVVERGLYLEEIRGFALHDGTLHLQFFSHVVLIALMVAASFIDVDEMSIPDAITVPGTLVGLALATMLPWSLLPCLSFSLAAPPLGHPLLQAGGAPVIFPDGQQVYLHFLTLASPGTWPSMLGGAPRLASLAIGLGCFWLWCFAILPRHWYGRHGWRRAAGVLTARMMRTLLAWPMLLLTVLGTAAVVLVWRVGGEHWAGMLTALVGLAGGGALVWAVRVFAGAALGREAMGFGDVTLMMMIGTFMGWQSSLLIFFFAPFAAIAVTLLQKGLRSGLEIPFGPYLCLATLLVLVCWADLWARVEQYFFVAWLVPAAVSVCIVLMAAMLAVWRFILTTFLTKPS